MATFPGACSTCGQLLALSSDGRTYCNTCMCSYSNGVSSTGKSIVTVTTNGFVDIAIEADCPHCTGTGKVNVFKNDLLKTARHAIRMFPGRKILAIKQVRLLTGATLMDAKRRR